MHRHVRHLRLICAREDDARQGRVLLEDALRTATLGDEGRLIVVRRLDLGRVSPRASSTHWSRRIEETFRAARLVSVHAADPAADHAPAVAFAHRHDPWLILAERIAADLPCREWYWPTAAPGWTPRHGAGETLRLCLQMLARHGGLLLTLELATRLLARGRLAALLRVLLPDDLASLRAEIERLVPRTAPTPPLAAALEFAATDLAFATSWGLADVRTRWLLAVHVARESSAGARASLAAVLTPALVRRILLAAGSGQPMTATSPAAPTAREKNNPPEGPAKPIVRQPADDRPLTAAAGLFFALPLLVRAGFPAHLATLPAEEAAVRPWQLLQLFLRHARTPETDPLPRALEWLPASRAPLGRWLLAANRRALAVAGLNLRRLIVRPARVALSSTHIDVVFRPSDADIRIRRAGLDIDPGWIPWLARAVAYHYTRED